MNAKSTLSLFALIWTISLNAQQPFADLMPSYEHLYEVNKQWQLHTDANPEEQISFDSDIDRIQYHLFAVEKYLRKNQPKGLAEESLKNRSYLLEQLKAYAAKKVFPENIYHAHRQPYFIDHKGTHCAVGYLIAASGRGELAQQISKEHNYDYVADIKTDGLSDWAMEHGITPDELAWIQPGYAPTAEYEPLGEGTNGPVELLYQESNINGRLFFAGSFTEVDGSPCENIGYYKDGQLHCLGDGLKGTINEVFVRGDEIYVIGALETFVTTYPMAIYKNGQWSYIEIPGREGAMATAGFSAGSTNLYELVIEHPTEPDQHEIWYLNVLGEWEKKATVNGKINDMTNSAQYGRVYAGDFDEAVIHETSGPDTVIQANNVLIFDLYEGSEWHSVGEQVSDEILVVKAVGSAIYFGGTCSNEPGQNNICLSRYLNDDLQPIILGEQFTNTGLSLIKDITFKNSSLFFAGEFEIFPFVGTFGRNVGAYDLVDNYMGAVGNFDKAVTGLVIKDDYVYFGGHFTEDLTSEVDLPHLARTALISNIDTVEEEKVSIFPNPVKKIATIEGIEGSFDYSILDLSGRIIKQATASDNNIDFEWLDQGVYILRIISDKGEATLKIVKS